VFISPVKEEVEQVGEMNIRGCLGGQTRSTGVGHSGLVLEELGLQLILFVFIFIKCEINTKL
jgi:hypothetical protein